MTGSKDKDSVLGKTCRDHLNDVFVMEKYKRREEITSKYLEKGNERENDALALCSKLLGVEYTKNDIRLYNDFIQGEPDTFRGPSIYKATSTLDTKVCWSAFTFFGVQGEKLNPDYEWQGHSYMDLTGAEEHTVAYTLINATAQTILDEKRKLSYKYGVLDWNSAENPIYVQKCKQIEINHIFDLTSFVDEFPYFEFHNEIEEWSYDIPEKDRLYTVTIKRDEEKIRMMHNQVLLCREHMNKNLFKIGSAEIAKGKIKKLKQLQKKVNL